MYFLRYSGDPGDTGPDYNMDGVMASSVGSRLSKINCKITKEECMDFVTSSQLFYNIRSQSRVHDRCSERIQNPSEHYECFDNYCLFDIENDPCEYTNVAKKHPQLLSMFLDMMSQFRTETIKQKRPDIDSKSDPKNFNGYWETWVDYGGSTENKSNLPVFVLGTLFGIIFLKLDLFLM